MKTTTTSASVKPGKNGYKILFATNTVIMNYKFAAAAAEYGTPEYNILKGIRADFPGMAEVVMSGREQKSPRPNTRLTYENMEKFIEVQEDSEALLEVFETVKAASKASKSPYKYVSDWFKAQFPDYEKKVVFKDGKLTTIPEKMSEPIQFKHKLAKVS